MNFFRDEKQARRLLGDWNKNENLYIWEINEACDNAFKIFSLD